MISGGLSRWDQRKRPGREGEGDGGVGKGGGVAIGIGFTRGNRKKAIWLRFFLRISYDHFHCGVWWLSTRRTLGKLKGCTHRVMKGLRWLSMSSYRCIKRVSRSVGILLCCDSAHSSK